MKTAAKNSKSQPEKSAKNGLLRPKSTHTIRFDAQANIEAEVDENAIDVGLGLQSRATVPVWAAIRSLPFIKQLFGKKTGCDTD